MAHFYGDLKGNRGEATRMGTANSGISGHIRGWDFGARVTCYVNRDGEDCVRVVLTGGSNNSSTCAVLFDGPKSRARERFNFVD